MSFAPPSPYTAKLGTSLLLSDADVQQQVSALQRMDVESYTKTMLLPCDQPHRVSLEHVFTQLLDTVIETHRHGPLLLMEGTLKDKPMALVGQDRAYANGVFQPIHHQHTLAFIQRMAAKQCAVISFIDTPGADAGEAANSELQAHHISALIAGFADLAVPNIAIVWGKGYSGGAIPFATANRLLIVRDGLFNTIQPQGLAAIARRQQLSWQACAKLVGLSAHELAHEGVVDGVLDLSPNDLVTDTDCIALKPLSELLYHWVGELEAEAATLQHANEVSNPYKVLRDATLKNRIQFSEGKVLSAPVLDKEMPTFKESITQNVFDEWIQKENPIAYELDLSPYWESYQGDKSEAATSRFAFEVVVALYHTWMNQFEEGIDGLKAYWQSGDVVVHPQVTLQTIIGFDDLVPYLLHHAEKLIEMDALYHHIIANAPVIASEYSKSQDKCVSEDTVLSIVTGALHCERYDAKVAVFCAWLHGVDAYGRLSDVLNKTSQWKKTCHPQMEDIHLLSVGYFISHVVLGLYASVNLGRKFDGRFLPQRIGRIKNFWYRLTQTSRQVRVASVLGEHKHQNTLSLSAMMLDYFSDFVELSPGLETANPKQFPGFAQSIAKQHETASKAVGLLTGVAKVKGTSGDIGFFISNPHFQAGAFDMAAAEKLCRLLAHCQIHHLPVVGMISSGGMQTKEGPAALFSMALVNSAINDFTQAMPNQLMIIGYGDCTGGAQASLVTHPKVKTAYLSGTNMPFAGQVVVPEHLSLKSTLSNYLFKQENAMDVLIGHPNLPNLDHILHNIDPEYAVAPIGLHDAIIQFVTQPNTLDEMRTSWTLKTKHDGHKSNFTEHAKSELPVNVKTINTVLIHARGCTASRLIQGAHSLNKRVVLVQSDPDMDSGLATQLHSSDTLVCLGGSTPDESYLNAESVLRIAELHHVDAIHPGIGFLSENAEFAALCADKGMPFIGPDASAIALMGDKAQAISTAKTVGLPVVPGSNGVVASVCEALEIADRIGYPLLIKSSFGGGGKGIAIVDSDAALEENFSRLSLEAKSAFGNGELYIERYLHQVRHVEVQVLRDHHGCCRILGVRDCSVQRNRQKIVEESGEYVLSDTQRDALYSWSEQLSHHIQYVGAGTVEFLYDLARDEFYFMEMNTRLQVEHPVTEMTSGIDIVAMQFAIAEGQSIADLPKRIPHHGHAIELRINAETIGLHPQSPVIPSAGKVTTFTLPQRTWARTLSFLEPNKDVTPFYDSLIIQLIAHGEDREDAIRKISVLLNECHVQGVDTNAHLLARIMEDKVFKQGDYSTGYLDEFLSQFEHDDNPTQKQDAPSYADVVGDNIYLKAPSAGVVYLSSSPSDPAYVTTGEAISGDSTLFLLEVMKVFMPIKLSTLLGKQNAQYEVVHVRADDGAYVQADDVIMILKNLTD